MPADSNRREFLKRAGLLALAAPGAAAVLDACTSVATSAKANTIRVGWAIEPDTMNPLTTYSTEAVEVLQLVYDNLIHYDLQLKPEPGLATSWSYSADGKSVTYKLRSAKWHDGKPFTSADAKFSFDVIQSKQVSQYAQWVSNLTSTEAPDASTLVLHFSKPQAFNPGIAVPILPQHIWQGMSAADIQKVCQRQAGGDRPVQVRQLEEGPVNRDRPQRRLVGDQARGREDHLDPVPERRRDDAEPAHWRCQHLPRDPADDLGGAEGRAERQARLAAVVLVPPHRDQRLGQPEVRREPAAQGSGRPAGAQLRGRPPATGERRAGRARAAWRRHPARRVRRNGTSISRPTSSSMRTRRRPRRCWKGPGSSTRAAARSAPRRTASR